MAHNSSGGLSLTHRAIALASFAVTVYLNIKYVAGNRHRLDNHHTFHTDHTAFTANVFFILVYWILLHLLQAGFLVLQYGEGSRSLVQTAVDSANPASATLSTAALTDIGWHFTLFNILHSVWLYLFARGHYITSEIIIFINFFNLLVLYVSHKPYAIRPLGLWAKVHFPAVAMPISWVFYAIFWNGAAAFHAEGFVARIVANVLIWDFLLVPGLFLILFNDWAVGFSSSYLVWALGVGQFFTKVVALQWIFAFVIASLLFIGSLLVAVSPNSSPFVRDTEAQTAPASASDERAPLLN
ncbi:hypothetical protein AWJ20_5270 [Sugiyamaella lignohabitans]|uniref:DUF1774-domain-containing protein n=1 Tax=Sugiyamaella lignohabitans TaxID=796027 RepID=A0A167EP60_9ASCO|nr:uncharacterized protein AWJ20_5270 [Sugiyamaella lignohabitans]ANB14305.1 hypothetical protein AWJ20_5270 [Sugiyamaella lignohabitans]